MPTAAELVPHAWQPGTIQPHCWRDPDRLTGPPELAQGPHPTHTTCCTCGIHFYYGEATAVQLAILGSTAHPLCILGSPGGGKTTALVRKLLLGAYDLPGSRWVLGRFDEDELLMTSYVTFEKEANRERWRYEADGAVHEQGPFLIQHHQKSEKYVEVASRRWVETGKKEDLSRIYLLGLKKGLGSLELTGFVVDHAEEVPVEMFHTLMDRCRYPADAPHQGVLAAYPPLKTHWIYKQFGEQVLRLPLDDNPYVTDAYKQEVTTRYARDPDGYRRFIQADWGLAVKGDPVFKAFHRTKYGQPWHVAGTRLRPIPVSPVYVGMDYGTTPAFVWVQLDALGRVLVYQGLACTEPMSLRQFLRERVWPYHQTTWLDAPEVVAYGDPSGEHRQPTDFKTCFQLVKELFPAWHLKAGVKEIPGRLNPMHKLLTEDTWDGGPRFLIDPQARLLIEAFEGGYSLDADGLPIKNHPYSDVMDALLYPLSRLLPPWSVSSLRRLYMESA